MLISSVSSQPETHYLEDETSETMLQKYPHACERCIPQRQHSDLVISAG